MQSQVEFLVVRILAFAISVAVVNGYILGQLITAKTAPTLNSNNENAYESIRTPFLAVDDFLPHRIENNKQVAPPQALRLYPPNLSTLPKKTNESNPALLKFKSSLLKKFNGSGLRNCFFTPIQCMIQYDVSKYTKLVDNNMLNYGGIAKRTKLADPFNGKTTIVLFKLS